MIYGEDHLGADCCASREGMSRGICRGSGLVLRCLDPRNLGEQPIINNNVGPGISIDMGLAYQ